MAFYPYPRKRTVSNTDFEESVFDVYNTAMLLLLKKHKDYGPTNISKSPGGPLNGLRVRMWDKTARLNHLLDNDATPENESLRDTFVDLLNYSAIALLVLDGKWPETDTPTTHSEFTIGDNSSIREQIAKQIEKDDFWESTELNEKQQHAVLAMRLRSAKIARGK